MEEAMLIELLKEVQKKYQCFMEIERITRDIGEALSRNDRTSVQILLGMRQEEMDKGDLSEKNIKCFMSVLPLKDVSQITNWLRGEEDGNADSLLERKLIERGKSIQMLLKRTIELDRHISIRLAGKDSYYQ